MLAMKKVELEPRRISAARRERNARSTFDVHLGDLELENAERAKSRRPQWQHQRKSPSSDSSASSGKRKRVESDDGEEEDELVAEPPIRKSTRSVKGKSVAGPKGRKRRVVESSEEEEESEEESSDEEYRPRTRSRTLRRSS